MGREISNFGAVFSHVASVHWWITGRWPLKPNHCISCQETFPSSTEVEKHDIMGMSHTFPGHFNWLEGDSSSSMALNTLSVRFGFPHWANPEALIISLASWEEEQSPRKDGRKEEGQTSLTGAEELGLLGQICWSWKPLEKCCTYLQKPLQQEEGETDHWVLENEILENACNSSKVDVSEGWNAPLGGER